MHTVVSGFLVPIACCIHSLDFSIRTGMCSSSVLLTFGILQHTCNEWAYSWWWPVPHLPSSHVWHCTDGAACGSPGTATPIATPPTVATNITSPPAIDGKAQVQLLQSFSSHIAHCNHSSDYSIGMGESHVLIHQSLEFMWNSDFQYWITWVVAVCNAYVQSEQIAIQRLYAQVYMTLISDILIWPLPF